MRSFKRNQVEEAISRVLDPGSSKPSTELRTRIKRLLETDRSLDQKALTKFNLTPFAFFGGQSPGSGKEVWFSEYETFALLVGLMLMGHGWPQTFAVGVMRCVRPQLEKEHAHTLSQDRSWLFDKEEIGRNAQAGAFAFDNQDPVLLSIVSKPNNADSDEPFAKVTRGIAEALRFAASFGGARTMFDVVGPAHRLTEALAQTRPRKRGRGTV